MLKLFTLDFSWQGALVGIAHSKEEMIKEWRTNTVNGKYLSEKEINLIEEFPLSAPLFKEFMGDS